jgi:hypothetical protein
MRSAVAFRAGDARPLLKQALWLPIRRVVVTVAEWR